MSDRIKQKICYFDLADIYQEQNWLEDLARKGLLLTYTGYLIYDFAYGEPTERRYRILPEKRKKIEQEELDIYMSPADGHVCEERMHRLCSIQMIRMHPSLLRMPLRRRSIMLSDCSLHSFHL
ncbi:MAG: DUF2812 domain-containing protein [Mogibacterium diversum]|nr:DUF2812 domain-containing protein [Mogibacterium diversum]